MYQLLFHMHKNKIIKSDYINNIKTILNTCGYSGLCEAQSVPNSKWLRLAFSQKLEDQYLQTWSSILNLRPVAQITDYSRMSLAIVNTSLYYPNTTRKFYFGFAQKITSFQ